MLNNTSTWIVIPNWNGEDFISESIASLRLQTKKTNIVVIDNGSVDKSITLIESQFPEVLLLKQPKNLGFAGGVNVGIRYALENGADYIALFNNDAVAKKDWFEYLVNKAKSDDSVGIITSKILRSDKNHIDSTGENYSVWGMPFPRDRNQEDIGQRNQAEEVFGASGGASLYSAKMLKEIGLFDEDFFAYFEDVDISFRAQLAGWDVWYEPSAVVYHKVSGTSSKLGSFSRYHSIKNFHLLYIKNMPGIIFWKYLPLFFIQGVRLFAGNLLKGHLLTHLRALGSTLVLLPHALTNRWHIQKGRKRTTQEIDALLYKSRPPKIPML